MAAKGSDKGHPADFLKLTRQIFASKDPKAHLHRNELPVAILSPNALFGGAQIANASAIAG
jgi:hypothetical protein